MIFQSDLRLPPAIRRWGCYFMALVYLFRRPGALEEYHEIHHFFEFCARQRWLLNNDTPVGSPGWYRAYIVAPSAIAEALSQEKFHFSAKSYSPKTYKTSTIARCDTPSGHHFFVPAQESVWPGPPLPPYNPDPSIAVDRAPISGYRLFTRRV